MNILELSKTVSKEEFKEALHAMKQVNDAGLMVEFLDLVKEMELEGTDLMSCIYNASYDLLIDRETGKYKPEVEKLMPKPGKNTNY